MNPLDRRPRPAPRLSRRDFLRLGGAAAAASVAFGFRPRAARAAPATAKTEHVILVAFAGGVRSRETFGTQANIPNLMKVAAAGVVCPQMVAATVGHYGATLSLFTGNVEYMGVRENDRGDHPTLFEYLRKQKDAPRRKAWLAPAGGPQQLNLSHSASKTCGAAFGASVAPPEGVFAADLKEILEEFGRPGLPGDEESAALARLRAGMDAELARRSGGGGAAAVGAGAAPGADPEAARRTERLLLDEVAGGGAAPAGPAANDLKALRVATGLLRLFKPTLLGVSLFAADVAHGSMKDYVEVIRNDDEAIGALWAAVQEDPELRDTTAFFVCPEFGRDKEPNPKGGLDHGDGSDDRHKVALFAAGPEFKKGGVLRQDFQTIDLCATVCQLLGLRPEVAPRSKVMKELWA